MEQTMMQMELEQKIHRSCGTQLIELGHATRFLEERRLAAIKYQRMGSESGAAKVQLAEYINSCNAEIIKILSL